MASSKSSLFLLIMCLILLTNVVLEAEAKAFFVFGDSMVDSGNNNYMVTLIRADKPPYGIDYPGQIATGRFSNGYNIPDLISQAIGEEPTMPYMSPDFTGEKLLVGANFASAGVGILNDTGTHFGHHIKIRMQMQYFEEYQQRLSETIGPEDTQRLVNKALTLITLGANDFVNNYYLPFSPTSRQYSIPDYVVYLISEYRKILLRLYEMGLRRILVTGTGPLGCAPAELAVRSQDGECSPELQTASTLFSTQLQQLLESLNSEIGSDVFIGAHTQQTDLDFVSNPEKYGFVTSRIACCGIGPYNGYGLCTIFSNLCPNRDLHVFWDAFHMTERANGIVVQLMLTGSTDYMTPMNISTIMALDADDIM